MFDDDIDQLDDVYGRFKRNGCLELPLFVEGKRQVKYDE